MATSAARRVKDYIAAVEKTGVGFAERETLSAREAALERLLMGLRTSEGVPFAELAPLGLTERDPRLAPLVEAGFIAAVDGRLLASLDGRRVLNRVIETLAG